MREKNTKCRHFTSYFNKVQHDITLPVFQFPPGSLVFTPAVTDGVDVFLLHHGQVDVAMPVSRKPGKQTKYTHKKERKIQNKVTKGQNTNEVVMCFQEI